jgi:hypothetical protein
MQRERRPHLGLQHRLLLQLVVLVAACAVLQARTVQAAPGAWSLTGSMSTAREFHTETLLLNGQVLVAGGLSGSAGSILASAELYNPSTGLWSLTDPMPAGRYDHSATRLNDGTVLVAGGETPTESQSASAVLYDPSTGHWTPTGSMNIARITHTATLLPDGKVLVAGGQGPGTLASAELYDPASHTWALTNPMNATRYLHSATLLLNGKVLVAGGGYFPMPASPIVMLASAELFDPVSHTWTLTSGGMGAARGNHGATLLGNGMVLVSGGMSAPLTEITTAEVFNPASSTWATTGSLNTARAFHGAALLGSGKVLVAGGLNGTNVLASAELYDPASTTWTLTGSLNTARDAHNGATLLSGGKVLVAGGEGLAGKLASAELFDPPTSSDTTPPTLTAAAHLGTSSGPTYTPGSWTNQMAVVTLTCTDNQGGSGVQSITYSVNGGASTTTGPASVDVPVSGEGSGQHVDGTCKDQAGNTSTPTTTLSNIQIDKTPPTATVTGASNGASYTLGNVPTAGCTASDGSGSGVATNATLTVSGGTTNGVGSYTASCTGAKDNAGNTQTSTASVTYTVVYQFSGFLAPVNNTPTVNTGKAGKSYPVKFQLTDASGGYVSALTAVKSVTYQATSCSSFSNDPTDPLEASTTGNSSLKYDSAAKQYIYNWATPSPVGCYTLFVTLDSGQVFSAYFNLS